MTLPYERTRAVLQTEQFLMDLLVPSVTPGVPKLVREEAGRLLRHYPTELEMEMVAERESKITDPLAIQVFGHDR